MGSNQSGEWEDYAFFRAIFCLLIGYVVLEFLKGVWRVVCKLGELAWMHWDFLLWLTLLSVIVFILFLVFINEKDENDRFLKKIKSLEDEIISHKSHVEGLLGKIRCRDEQMTKDAKRIAGLKSGMKRYAKLLKPHNPVILTREKEKFEQEAKRKADQVLKEFGGITPTKVSLI